MNSILSEYEKGNPILETGKHPVALAGMTLDAKQAFLLPHLYSFRSCRKSLN